MGEKGVAKLAEPLAHASNSAATRSRYGEKAETWSKWRARREKPLYIYIYIYEGSTARLVQ